MLRQYRDAVCRAGPQGEFDRALWLAPTSRTAATVRQQLTDGLDACLTPGVMTFDQLTKLILTSGEAPPSTFIPASTARELLRRALQSLVDQKRLSHFRDAARRAGFVDLVATHLR